MQDVNRSRKTGKLQLRHYAHAPIFNYGFIPQTYEDGQLGGDDDPLDLVDLGQTSHAKPVLGICDYLVLGCLGLVD